MTVAPRRRRAVVASRASSAASRRAFGRTWWGRAWVDALEQRARLDPNRLPRGRTYARSGRVGELAVSAGEVRAAVRGSRVTPYVVHVRVRQLDPGEWDRLLGALVAKVAHAAALLDGELPPEVVADAAAVGVSLLPEAGELGPGCSCPDWASPCKHAAAVVYLVADVLDTDPFALLLLRGRSRDDVLAGLRARRMPAPHPGAPAPRGALRLTGGAGGGPAGVRAGGRGASVGGASVGRVGGGLRAGSGVVASEAYAAAAARRKDSAEAGPPSLPAPPSPPPRPGEPAPLAVDPPASSGLRRDDLAELAADAARRAWELCIGEGDGGLTLDPDLDVVRRASARLGPASRARLSDLALRARVAPRHLGRQAAAWALGGADALEVVERTWFPPPGSLEEARDALGVASAALDADGAVRVWRNRMTVGPLGLQLRLSRSGAWYRFEQAGEGWQLAAGPEADPAALLRPGPGDDHRRG